LIKIDKAIALSFGHALLTRVHILGFGKAGSISA